MEAMWINFSSMSGKTFAVRPYLGGVNGISGETSMCNLGSVHCQIASTVSKQDYIVLPEQIWLDGIATAPGIVKQFVATQMAPPKQKPANQEKSTIKSKLAGKLKGKSTEEEQSGSSVEWQVTGRDELGGLQLHIIPQFDISRMFAGSMRNVIKTEGNYNFQGATFNHYDDACLYDVLKTPKELGKAAGEVIHIKDLTSLVGGRTKRVDDLAEESPIPLKSEDVIVELTASYYGKPVTFKISLFGASEPARVLKVSMFPIYDGRRIALTTQIVL
jgi:hypothetical protein